MNWYETKKRLLEALAGFDAIKSRAEPYASLGFVTDGSAKIEQTPRAQSPALPNKESTT